MLPTEDQEILLGDEITDAVLRVVKDELDYESVLRLEGLIGITLDAGSPFHIQIQTTYYKEEDLELDELEPVEDSQVAETPSSVKQKVRPSKKKESTQQVLKVAISPLTLKQGQKSFKSTDSFTPTQQKGKHGLPKQKQKDDKTASPAAADQAEADVPLITSSTRRIRKPKKFEDCVVDLGSIKKHIKQEPGSKEDEESPQPAASPVKAKATPSEPVKKSGRGRPPKPKEPEVVPVTPRKASQEETATSTTKRGRGRPKKEQPAETETPTKQSKTQPLETPAKTPVAQSPEKEPAKRSPRKAKKRKISDDDEEVSLEESTDLAWKAILADELAEDKDAQEDSDDDYVPSDGGFDANEGDESTGDTNRMPEDLLGSPALAEPSALGLMPPTALGMEEDEEAVGTATQEEQQEPEEESFKEVVSVTHVLSMEDIAPAEEQDPERVIPKKKRGRPPGPWVRRPKPQPGERPFVCEQCGKAYTRKDHLKYHMMSHTGQQEEKKYACEWCGKRYVRLSQLNDHRRTHTGERPYQCHQCGKSFKSNKDLWNHKINHRTDRPFVCEHENCDWKFTTKGALIKHKEVHLGMKPWECDKCGKKFARKGGLVEHQLTHNKANYYHCDICGKGFPRKDRVEVHKRLHLNIRPYVCHLCGDGFTQSGHLRNHIKAHSKIKKRRRGVGIPPGPGAKKKGSGSKLLVQEQDGEQTFTFITGNQGLNTGAINQAIQQVAQLEGGMQIGGEDNTQQIIFKTEDGTPFNMADISQDENMQIIFKTGEEAQNLVSDENTQIIYITNAVLDENNQLVSMEGTSGMEGTSEMEGTNEMEGTSGDAEAQEEPEVIDPVEKMETEETEGMIVATGEEGSEDTQDVVE